MDDSEVEIKQSHIGQFDDGLGVFAKRDFKKGKSLFSGICKFFQRQSILI